MSTVSTTPTMTANERDSRICAWLASLFGRPFEVLPFTIPTWAKYLAVDPRGTVSAHEAMPVPDVWHPSRGDSFPKWTSDMWWWSQGRDESVFEPPEKPKCDDVWDALIDIYDENYRGAFAAKAPS